MIWFWLWIGGMITFLVPVARFALRTLELDDDPEPEEIVMAAGLAVVTVPLWPLFIPGYYVYWMLTRPDTQK